MGGRKIANKKKKKGEVLFDKLESVIKN